MSFRTRLTLVAAVAVAIAVAIASALAYVAVRTELRNEVDEGLSERANTIMDAFLRVPFGRVTPTANPREFLLDIPVPELGAAGGYVQLVNRDRVVYRQEQQGAALPVSARVYALADGRGEPFYEDVTVANTDVRVLTFVLTDGVAAQVARPLTEVNETLDRLRLFLLLVSLGGIAGAAAIGLVVARTALAPVRRLTDAAEHVTATGDLARRIDDGGRDELSRLASSFNTMLDSLEESQRAQRQLVSDASHELRTPLTSMRTNIEVLARDRQMPPEERERLLRDVVEQLEELTALVAEIVELARGEHSPQEEEDVRLDVVVSEAIDRARRDRQDVRYVSYLDDSVVRGVPTAIARAVSNLLDNAGKWSPPGGTVEVAVRDGSVLVRDHGPGIEESDLPHVFDRFYRSSSARGMPGSGLGLAIVRQVAQAHGGDVRAERADGGGTLMVLRLNGHSNGRPS